MISLIIIIAAIASCVKICFGYLSSFANYFRYLLNSLTILLVYALTCAKLGFPLSDAPVVCSLFCVCL